MADRKRTNQRPASGQKPRSGRRSGSKARASRSKRPSVDFLALAKRRTPEFKPDSENTGFLKKLHMTRLQQMHLLKWVLYVLICVLLLVIQDVIMSKVSIFGATTDLVVCAILLMTVIEGTDVGSVFVLMASLLFYFSGSAPGPYSVALLTIVGIAAAMFRQLYWHRNMSSIVLCASIALMLYELGVYGIALFLGLTYWSRIGVFLTTGILSCIVMLPLYPLINVIGQIGGNTWKE